jgi:DNA-directed RNA polymerase subunit beta
VKGENVPDPGIPESFKVLVKELQSIGLDIKVLDEDEEEISLQDVEDEDVSGRDSDEERGRTAREVGNMGSQYEEPQILEADDYADGNVDNEDNQDLIADVGNFNDGMSVREMPDANLDDYDN